MSPLNNLPGPPSHSWLTGNLALVWNRHSLDFHRDLALKYGPVVNLKGWFNKPALYVYDPKALNSLIIKDQNVYEESEMFIHTQSLVAGPGLTATLGDHHRKQRKLLNPVFSMAHMRRMTPIFYEVVDRLRAAIETRIADGPREIDVLDWLSRTALELIGQGGFGHSFDSLLDDVPTDEYAAALKDLTPAIVNMGVLQYVVPYVARLGSPRFRRRLLKFVPSKRLHRIARGVDIMHEHSVNIYNQRKAALEKTGDIARQQIGGGNDLMSILLKANMEAETEEEKLPEEELIAQVSTFSSGAVDTTSSSLAKILELLAEHPDVQTKLRAELLQAHAANGEKMSYEELMQLPYLDAICRETLRVYPPAVTLTRYPRQDIILPLSQPVRGLDGHLMGELPIPKGTQIFVGITGANLNRGVWGEDALEWKPERWLFPLPETVSQAHVPGVYSNLMTFLGGGRACIGFKFSELEMKLVLSILIARFNFELTGKLIYWNMSLINYPSMGKDDMTATMKLKVGLYKSDA